MWNHALTLAFVVHSNHEDMPTLEETIPALLRRVAELLCDRDEAKAALGEERPFDSYREKTPDWSAAHGVIAVTVVRPPVISFTTHALLGKEITR